MRQFVSRFDYNLFIDSASGIKATESRITPYWWKRCWIRRIWKEAVVSKFTVLHRFLSRGTEKSLKEAPKVVGRLQLFEPDISQIQADSVTCWASLLCCCIMATKSWHVHCEKNTYMYMSTRPVGTMIRLRIAGMELVSPLGTNICLATRILPVINKSVRGSIIREWSWLLIFN